MVGKAYQHLLRLRMERGPMEHDEAVAELRRWWADQS
jgi:poly(A) polymerase